MDDDAEDLQPVGVGDILEFAFRIYRQRFGALVRAAAVVVIPLWLLTAVVLLGTPAGDAATVGAGVVVAALGAMASQLSTAATFMIVTGVYLGVQQSWQGSVAFAWRRLGPLLWLHLVYSVLLVLGFIAFVIPGIYLAVAWAISVPVLLFEDIRGFGALRRSRELLRGRWWPTAGLLMLVALMTSLAQALMSALLPLLVAGSGSDAARNFAEAAAGLLGSVVTAPFTAAVITVLFFDALVRKEGFSVSELGLRMGVDRG